MDDFDKHVSPELREAISRFGFHKVAARMYGVADITDKTASEIVGRKLMTRLASWRAIQSGLAALKTLEE